MNITKQILKKTVLVGTIALSIAVFAESEHPANTAIERAIVPTKTVFFKICFVMFILYLCYHIISLSR